jgi:hypothetical protein
LKFQERLIEGGLGLVFVPEEIQRYEQEPLPQGEVELAQGLLIALPHLSDPPCGDPGLLYSHKTTEGSIAIQNCI